MLSACVYKELNTFFSFCEKYKILPYKWNISKKLLVVSDGYYENLALWLSTVWYLFQIYKILPLILGIYGEEYFRGLGETVIQCIFFIACSTFFCFNGALILRKRELCHVLNRYLEFDSLQQKKFGPYDPKLWDEIYWTVKCSNWLPVILPTLFSSMTYYMQNDVRYCLGTCDKHIPPATWKVIFWVIAEFLQSMSMTTVFVFYLYVMYICSSVTSFWLEKIETQANTVHHMDRWRRRLRVSHCLTSYRVLALISTEFNTCMKSEAMPALLTLNLGNHVLSLYFALHRFGKMPWAGYAIFPVFNFMWVAVELLVYPRMGKVYENSVAALRAWRGNDFVLQDSRRALRKRWASLRPLGVACSSYYVMSRATTLYVFMFVSTCVINVSLIL